MKTQRQQGLHRLKLKILAYANFYYISRVAKLEKALAKKPQVLQIDMIGTGEIPADTALLIRSVIMERSPKTRVVTHARSSLQGSSVLVWLLGDVRLIRDDARLFFRRAALGDDGELAAESLWENEDSNSWDPSSEVDPDEADYVRVLELINQFLPVKELAGRMVGPAVLRQFGLVENEKVDEFLATAFERKGKTAKSPADESTENHDRGDSKTKRSRPARR